MEQPETISHRRSYGFRHPQAPDLPLEPLYRVFENNFPSAPLKDHHSRKTFRLQLAGEDYYLKFFTYQDSDRYYDIVRRCISPTRRAFQQYHRVEHLRRAGFNLALPCLALARRESLLVYRSLILFEALKGTNIMQWLADRPAFSEICRVTGTIIQQLRQMHRRKIAFGDTNPKNLLVGGNREIFWTDYDDLKINYYWPASKLRDLRRLLVPLTERLLELEYPAEEVFSGLVQQLTANYSLASWSKWFLFYRIEKKLNLPSGSFLKRL